MAVVVAGLLLLMGAFEISLGTLALSSVFVVRSPPGEPVILQKKSLSQELRFVVLWENRYRETISLLA